MRYFDIRRQRVRIDSETVILRGDGDPSASQIIYWLIRAEMSEFQLEGRSAESEAKDLMAETNPEDRFLADQIAHGVMRIRERSWIAGPVRKKNSIGIECKHVFRSCRCGNNGDAEALLPQETQDVFFNAVVIGRDAKPDRRKCAFASAIFSRDRPRRA